MPTLGELRQEHTKCIAKLILYIHSEGYQCSLSEGYIADTARHIIQEIRHDLLEAGLAKEKVEEILKKIDPTPHREDGGHLKGISVDINIFKNGKWLSSGKELIWKLVGRYWLSLSTHARWNPNDPNHFGFIHAGVS